VYVSENSLRTRLQWVRAEFGNPLLRLRRLVWETRSEIMMRRAISKASGLQCNGTPTFEAYKRLNSNPLLYFDSRVSRDLIVTVMEFEQRKRELLANRPLRLAFSGRLAASKGADHLVAVADELRRLGVAFRMDICGDGELRSAIQTNVEIMALTSVVGLRSVLDFSDELMPFVRRNVDLFVCCHRQGDPSCTYLETMACGTPVVGYANEALTGIIEESGAGWATPLDKPKLLARKIMELNRQRAQVVSVSCMARDFAQRHTFEETFRRRIEHMLDCRRRKPSGKISAISRP
jgi:glycosyltransferase involved in cell wall biosynthesis